MRRSLDGDEHQDQQYLALSSPPWTVYVRDMEGLAASVLLIAILLGVLLVAGGLVYLLAQRLRRRSPEPPRKPVNRWLGIGGILLVLLIIGLWAGIRSASNPHPQPAGPLVCPTGGIWAPIQRLCPPL